MKQRLSLLDDDKQVISALERAGFAVSAPTSGEAEALRKVRAAAGVPVVFISPADSAPVTVGDLVLDDARRQCTWKGKLVDITVTEFLLVRLLAEKTGHVKTRAQLMDYAFGDSLDVDSRAVDSHVKRIRRKFREQDPGFDRIETVYGIGYRYKE